jgi:hypothetical protein
LARVRKTGEWALVHSPVFFMTIARCQTLPTGRFLPIAKALAVVRVARLLAAGYRLDVVLILASTPGRGVDW